jgi:hypothetical protein
MSTNEAYSKFGMGKYLPHTFRTQNGLQEEDGLQPLLSNFALGYVIINVQINYEWFELNGTYPLLAYVVQRKPQKLH